MPNICSPADDIGDTSNMELGNSACVPAKPQPSTVWDVLLDWEHTRLWEDLHMVGNADWIAEAI